VDPKLFPAALRKATRIQTGDISTMVREYFKTLGADLDSPGKSVFFNDGMSELFVKATATDLDKIENAIEAFNQVAPQIHIKARFLEVTKESLTLLKPFPEATNGVRILSSASFAKLWQSLSSNSESETLAEPEVVTTSGRQTQMRATTIKTERDVVFDVVVNRPIVTNNVGAVLDVVPNVLPDGYTINLKLIPSLIEFTGYETPPPVPEISGSFKVVQMPLVLPTFRFRQTVTTLNVLDGQTVVLGGLPNKNYVKDKEIVVRPKPSDKELLIFITATIVDPAGNPIHPNSEN
jgi:Flp pilus assembly secretin CpaC